MHDLVSNFATDSIELCRETEPDWDKDLAVDVKGECQAKYGQVLHIKVEKDSEVSEKECKVVSNLYSCNVSG